MKQFKSIARATELNLLVAFFDLTLFSRFARGRSNQETFDLLSAYFELVGDIISSGGGMVVKFMGDAGLIVFPEENIDTGVLSLRELRSSGDRWLSEQNTPCRNAIQAHFGPVVCGPIGTRDNKHFDILGDTVNTAAMLKTRSFAISPQVFRKLKPDTRKHFKKHTPPVTYIPVEEKHPD